MALTERDAIDAGETITEALKRLCLLNPTLGITEQQEQELKEEIQSRSEKYAENLTNEKLKEALRDTTFPEEAETAVRKWMGENLAEHITEGLNNEFCERTQSVIEEYDLVKRCDLDIQEEVEQYSINGDQVEEMICEHMSTHAETYVEDHMPDMDNMKESCLEDLKECMDQEIKEQLDKFNLNDNTDISNKVRKVLISFFNPVDADQRADQVRDARRYRYICQDILGLDLTLSSYEKIAAKAQENRKAENGVQV